MLKMFVRIQRFWHTIRWSRGVFLPAIMVFFTILACKKSEKATAPTTFDPASQDVTFVYRIESPSSIEIATSKLKGERLRVDDEEGVFSVIFDPRSEPVYLDHHKKVFVKVLYDPPETKGMSESTSKICKDSCKMQFTGRKLRIGNLDCEEFEVWDSMSQDYPVNLRHKVTAWIPRDLKGGAVIQKRKETAMPSELSKFLKTITGKEVTAPGFVAKSETIAAGGAPTVTTCESLTFERLSDEDFLIPRNYTEIKQESQ